MPKITYLLTDGTAQSLDVPIGTSVRDAALDDALAGIEGECGGFLNCATCHVYVDDAWAGRLPRPRSSRTNCWTARPPSGSRPAG